MQTICNCIETKKTAKPSAFVYGINFKVLWNPRQIKQLVANHLATGGERLNGCCGIFKMNRFILAQTAHEIDALKPAWEWLYLQQSEATFFQSFYWNRLAAECFRDERPTVVFVETDSGAALIPAAVRKDSHLCLLGEELFDYRDVLWAGDCSVLTRAWRILAERGLPLAQTPVCMGSMPERWSIFEIEDFCHAPCIAQGTGPDDFAASHSRLARQLRRLARVGVTVERHSGDNSALLREIYARKAALSNVWGENLFADPGRVRFITEVAAGAPSACQIFTLETASTLVSALVAFQDGNMRRFYTTYFDAAWAHYSPGVALLFEATRLSLAEGLGCDYMTGEQEYKLRLATTQVQLCRAHGKLRRDDAGDRELSLAA